MDRNASNRSNVSRQPLVALDATELAGVVGGFDKPIPLRSVLSIGGQEGEEFISRTLPHHDGVRV